MNDLHTIRNSVDTSVQSSHSLVMLDGDPIE